MNDPADPYRQRRPILPILLLGLVLLLVGMGAMAWLVYRYDAVADLIRPIPPNQTVVLPPPVLPSTRLDGRTRAAPADVVETIVDQRIGQIEEKVEDIGQRAQSATSEALRAERLLIAFAARRAIDRGVPLGYLETLLRERFGRGEPRAVATIISASRQPVTIKHLRDRLDTIAPQLSTDVAEVGWWKSFQRELADLIVIRHPGTPPGAPVDRLQRARNDLASGQVDAALAEIARLPGQKAAAAWIGEARRHVQAQIALDRIESAALLRPTYPQPVTLLE